MENTYMNAAEQKRTQRASYSTPLFSIFD